LSRCITLYYKKEARSLPPEVLATSSVKTSEVDESYGLQRLADMEIKESYSLQGKTARPAGQQDLQDRKTCRTARPA